MTALLLRLAGPLQSWGTSSRFTRRATDRVPSKSGIVGLLAAARGIRRTDSLEELLGLKLAVRTEQAGRLERDFQTAARPGERTPISVSTRHYLSDAVFLAAVESDDAELLTGLAEAVRAPYFPLYLGRRSCPLTPEIDFGARDGQVSVAPVVLWPPRPGTAVEALHEEPWQASKRHQRSRSSERTVELELVADCDPGTPGAELVRDEPVEFGFDPHHRQWAWRSVKRHEPVSVPNLAHRGTDPPNVIDRHDPMAVL